MKKILTMSLLTLSVIAFAKSENPILKNGIIEQKALVAKKNSRDEQKKSIQIKQKQDPFSQCVLNNAISIQVGSIVMGTPVDGDTAIAVATVMCSQGFGLQ